jgi:hypothetical protein
MKKIIWTYFLDGGDLWVQYCCPKCDCMSHHLIMIVEDFIHKHINLNTFKKDIQCMTCNQKFILILD